MKVSDFVIEFLLSRGVSDIFTVSGGGIMHLTDSVRRNSEMRYICNFHEQACAIAAESYARVRNGVGACLVTTGPGSTNALSGIAGAYVDSIPVIVISGQVRRELIANYKKLRQLGPQEINIDELAKPVVKYFITLLDPSRIRYEMEAALWHATSGRPGPVWINIPLDVQSAEFDLESSPSFVPPEGKLETKELVGQVAKVIRLLSESKRPVVIAGNGVHLSSAGDRFRKLIEKTNAPALLTVGSVDLLEENHPLSMGRFGPLGQRRANFTLQNSDLVLSIGASMSVSSIGFNTAEFAPQAKRIMVNIDAEELLKPNYKPDLGIVADAGSFIDEFLRQSSDRNFVVSSEWEKACKLWKNKYPTITQDYLEDTHHVNSYCFSRKLSQYLPPDGIVVTGNSLDFWSVYQSFEVKVGQRVYTNINYGSMGWDLPAVIGASVGKPNQPICIPTGDGSIQFNVQELMTIRRNNLPIKIFVLNNQGYESIRSTQKNYFEGRLFGSDYSSGIDNPDFQLLAAAYGIPYACIHTNQELDTIENILKLEGPVLCELKLSPNQPRSPKIMSVKNPDGSMSSRPLQDMAPFLPREEVWENMHLFDV